MDAKLEQGRNSSHPTPAAQLPKLASIRRPDAGSLGIVFKEGNTCYTEEVRSTWCVGKRGMAVKLEQVRITHLAGR